MKKNTMTARIAFAVLLLAVVFTDSDVNSMAAPARGVVQNAHVGWIWTLAADIVVSYPSQYHCNFANHIGDPYIPVIQSGSRIYADDMDPTPTPFVLQGTVNGTHVVFTITGWGITPGDGGCTLATRNHSTTYLGIYNKNTRTIQGSVLGSAEFSFEFDDEGNHIWQFVTWTGTFTVKVNLPTIREITIQGVGTDNDIPETGSPVRLEADLDVPAGCEVTQCSWTGDLNEPGEGDPAHSCRHEYVPATGPGPDISTYGPKHVFLTITYEAAETGATGQDSRSHAYKVFFEKEGDDDGACHWSHSWRCEPNWFEYWGDDGAVPELAAPDVVYATLLNGYGQFDPLTGNINLGAEAAGDDRVLVIPDRLYCRGVTLGGTNGIDTAAVTVAHERRHKEIHNNWQPGGDWFGMDDSDSGNLGPEYRDDIPDDYEVNVAHTDPHNVDSCDLEHVIRDIYKFYGDNEYQARLAEVGQRGNPEHDWANPGKQAGTVATSLAESRVQPTEPEARSGLDGLGAPHSSQALSLYGMASLSGDYADVGMDADGDGLYNSLRLSVGVQVTETATYNLIAWLEDTVRTTIAGAGTRVVLTPGVHVVDLSFDGLGIRASGVDGPYSVAHVELQAGSDGLLVDSVENVYTTAAYQYTDFELPIMAFTRSFDDVGLDTNADSLYDLLRISVDLDVQEAGIYTIIGELECSDSMAVVRTTASLATGSQTTELDFDGRLIFQHRQDGPYHLRKLRVEDTTGNRIDFIYDAYTTAAYAYGQFQHSSTIIDATSYIDQGVDADGDGDYEYLRVEFQISLDQESTYRLLATLKDSEGEKISDILQDMDLLAGPNRVNLDFPGDAIYKHGIDGPYQVTSVALLDVVGNIIDYQPAAHTTQVYGHLDFDSGSFTAYLPLILKQ